MEKHFFIQLNFFRDNDSILIQASNDGLPYKCFTIYSLLDKPNEEPRKLRLNDGKCVYLMQKI